VIVLRPGEHGFSIFMVRRHRRSAFMPNAWVFPGGRVDQSDRLADHGSVSGGEVVREQLGLQRDDATAYLVAAVRETWEEAGIWLGDGSLPRRTRVTLQAGEAQLGSLLSEHAAAIDLDRLRAWSWWITPEAEPKRYDTRFLVARADDAVGSHDAVETVDSRWMTPHEALDGHAAGDVTLAPPTWWTLRELSAFGTIDAVFAATDVRSRRPIQPILFLEPPRVELRLPGHASHAEPAIAGITTCITLSSGRWQAE
jgi:8-oxo-dGTP pyrophosphatase MutT (NUDIX family)